MLKATEANAIAQKFKKIEEILWGIENDISYAAKSGDFECLSNVDPEFNKYVPDAIKMVEDAGYVVTTSYDIKHEAGPEGNVDITYYHVKISWKDAEL